MKDVFNLKRSRLYFRGTNITDIPNAKTAALYNYMHSCLSHMRDKCSAQQMINKIRLQNSQATKIGLLRRDHKKPGVIDEGDIPYSDYGVIISHGSVKLDDSCAEERNLIDLSCSRSYFSDNLFFTGADIKALCDVKGTDACLAQYFLDQDNLYQFSEFIRRIAPGYAQLESFIKTQVDYVCRTMSPSEINKMFGKAYKDYDRKLWDYMLYPTYLGTPTEPPRPKERPDRAILDLMMIAFNTKMNELTAVETKIKGWTP